ncbi:unnamed protein product [Schistosoma curassoni]|uniref:Uncharacterized protein n=1 Tax=Schistosoma curassoni TaxID=6186 RepID=A0A183JEG3_9TREM|nr:unnamed protein product [Schistosoma curassoni]
MSIAHILQAVTSTTHFFVYLITSTHRSMIVRRYYPIVYPR